MWREAANRCRMHNRVHISALARRNKTDTRRRLDDGETMRHLRWRLRSFPRLLGDTDDHGKMMQSL